MNKGVYSRHIRREYTAKAIYNFRPHSSRAPSPLLTGSASRVPLRGHHPAQHSRASPGRAAAQLLVFHAARGGEESSRVVARVARAARHHGGVVLSRQITTAVNKQPQWRVIVAHYPALVCAPVSWVPNPEDTRNNRNTI